MLGKNVIPFCPDGFAVPAHQLTVNGSGGIGARTTSTAGSGPLAAPSTPRWRCSSTSIRWSAIRRSGSRSTPSATSSEARSDGGVVGVGSRRAGRSLAAPAGAGVRRRGDPAGRPVAADAPLRASLSPGRSGRRGDRPSSQGWPTGIPCSSAWRSSWRCPRPSRYWGRRWRGGSAGPHAAARPLDVRRLAIGLAVVGVLVFVTRTSLVATYRVVGPSMLPTLEIGDRLLVNRLAYGVKLPFAKTYLGRKVPKRGDLVVFRQRSGSRARRVPDSGQAGHRVARRSRSPSETAAFKSTTGVVPNCDAGPYTQMDGRVTVRGRLAVEYLDDRDVSDGDASRSSPRSPGTWSSRTRSSWSETTAG